MVGRGRIGGQKAGLGRCGDRAGKRGSEGRGSRPIALAGSAALRMWQMPGLRPHQARLQGHGGQRHRLRVLDAGKGTTFAPGVLDPGTGDRVLWVRVNAKRRQNPPDEAKWGVTLPSVTKTSVTKKCHTLFLIGKTGGSVTLVTLYLSIFIG